MSNIDVDWIDDYLKNYKKTIFNRSAYTDLLEVKELFEDTNKVGSKVILAGNGGSASIASHCSVDLTKNAGIKAINYNEADLITCFANDYGYERWVEKAIDFYADSKDVLILISSSGKSKNMLNACKAG